MCHSGATVCAFRGKWRQGAERIVSYLTEELVRQGHEVALFAAKHGVSPKPMKRVHSRHIIPFSGPGYRKLGSLLPLERPTPRQTFDDRTPRRVLPGRH